MFSVLPFQSRTKFLNTEAAMWLRASCDQGLKECRRNVESNNTTILRTAHVFKNYFASSAPQITMLSSSSLHMYLSRCSRCIMRNRQPIYVLRLSKTANSRNIRSVFSFYSIQVSGDMSTRISSYSTKFIFSILGTNGHPDR
jgi:cysteine sulfinate desulfinase/cysteine desulfurase-like protein